MTVHPAAARGSVTVPSSKSHTIRALLIAACADGPSSIGNVLESADAGSCIAAVERLGATVTVERRHRTGMDIVVTPPSGGILAKSDPRGDGPPTGDHGSAGSAPPTVDVGNSGTTLYLLSALAALRPGGVRFDGDASIRGRSAAPLLAALTAMGAAITPEGQPGCAPYTVMGPLTPGRTVPVESPTSQYLSALLLTAPVLPGAGPAERSFSPGVPSPSGSTTLDILLLNEHPYVDMTCWWLDGQGIRYHRDGYRRFVVPAGQRYRPVVRSLPGDYSSATFWFAAAAVTGGSVTVRGLAPDDVQGDRGVLEILARLGCSVVWDETGVTVSGRPSRGGTFDLNAMPDALPALSVVGAAAPAPVALENVPQARQKETDRIAVMARELRRLGGRVEERPDGLVVHPAPLSGGEVESHEDHRVAMALAVAALGAAAPVTIHRAAAAAVTYPSFFRDLAAVAPGSIPGGSEGA